MTSGYSKEEETDLETNVCIRKKEAFHMSALNLIEIQIKFI